MFINALKIWSWKGRICRWQYLLALFLIAIIGGCIIATGMSDFIVKIFCSILFVPSQIKRLHDIGWSGFLLLLILIPFIGPLIGLILGLILLVSSGTKGPNNYGKPPHQLEEKE